MFNFTRSVPIGTFQNIKIQSQTTEINKYDYSFSFVCVFLGSLSSRISIYRKEPIGSPRQSQTILQFLSYFHIDWFILPCYSVVLPFHVVFPIKHCCSCRQNFHDLSVLGLRILQDNSVTGLPAKTQLDSKVLVNFRSHVQT